MVTLAPFLNKAFHIDDPLFVWMAQQISNHPLDPYGCTVNWASFPEPMWKAMQNPPLCAYYIAAISAMAGWSELALHLGFLIWPVMSVLGTFAVARRFCSVPGTVALAAFFTPVFLVSATNVMCDVMLLALWIWAIECWLAGLESNRWCYFALSAFLITAASLTKYFGIALLPLLATHTLFCGRRKSWRLLFLLFPIAAMAGYELWTKAAYGQGLFSYAVFYSRTVSSGSKSNLFSQLLTGLAFAGGSILLPAFFGRRRTWFLAVLGLAAFYFWLPINPDWQLGNNVVAVKIEGGIFAAIGAGTIAFCLFDLSRERSAQSVFLTIWIVGTFVFAVFLNWSITARTFLPMAPAVAILVVRHVQRSWPIFLAAIVSLFIACADYVQADSARDAASFAARQLRNSSGTLWFQSHWGFQYYMQRFGSTPLNAHDSEITTGDTMIVPANNTAVTAIRPDKILAAQDRSFRVFPYLTTMGRGTGAAFYSSARGPIPWAIDRVPPETYYVVRFR